MCSDVAGAARLDDCLAEWTAGTLAVGNGAIRRRWRIENGLLRPAALLAVDGGREWLRAEAPACAPGPGADLGPCLGWTVEAAPGATALVADTALLVRLTARFAAGSVATCLRIFPGDAAITSWMELDGVGLEPCGGAAGGAGNGGNESAAGGAGSARARADLLPVEHRHRLLGAVSFRDDTDREDSLVHEAVDLLTTRATYRYRGNLFWLEDQVSGDGLVLLLEGPFPHVREWEAGPDLEADAGLLACAPRETAASGRRATRPWTVLVHSGGAGGRTAALHRHQRRHRRYDGARDEVIWHSVWGDRNRDGRVCETFMLAESERLQRLGMDYLYLIDGWQRGASTNSVHAARGGRWSGQWQDPAYWEAHPERFPRGFAPLLEAARARGQAVGFWYNPDSSCDYANWRRDADLVLGMHRRWGFRIVKFDGVYVRTPVGEANLCAIMRAVVEESGGAMAVELDLTAGRRSGWFGGMPWGVCFLENRYTDWARYWPHCTLRNLWQLAHWVDPRRIRVEFLNNRRNRQLYGDDPLAPAAYRMDHLLAIAAVANPLAWFEASGLDEEQEAELAPAVAAYRRWRGELHQGGCLPIGEAPDGFSWSGFHVRCGEAGHLLLFRGLRTPQRTAWRLDRTPDGVDLVLGGATWEVSADGSLEVVVPEAPGFAWLRYRCPSPIPIPPASTAGSPA